MYVWLYVYAYAHAYVLYLWHNDANDDAHKRTNFKLFAISHAHFWSLHFVSENQKHFLSSNNK